MCSVEALLQPAPAREPRSNSPEDNPENPEPILTLAKNSQLRQGPERLRSGCGF